MSDHSNEHAETDRLPGYSEIMAFHMNHPRATVEQIAEFTGKLTAQLCSCGNQMRKFEVWNGECEPCRLKREDRSYKRGCGCMKPDGGFWIQRHGWHYADGSRDVAERCPKYWEKKTGEIDVAETVGGVVKKRKARVEFYVDEEDRRKLRRNVYDPSGRLIEKLSSRPESDKW